MKRVPLDWQYAPWTGKCHTPLTTCRTNGVDRMRSASIRAGELWEKGR